MQTQAVPPIAALTPERRKRNWSEIEECILKRTLELVERPWPRIASNVRLWVSDDLIPIEGCSVLGSQAYNDALPEIRGRVGEVLRNHDILNCERDMSIHIVPSSSNLRRQFALDLDWMQPVSEARMQVIRQDMESLHMELKHSCELTRVILEKLP